MLKFWEDNLDKQRHVCDLRSDNQGSTIVGRSHTPALELSFTGQLKDASPAHCKPHVADVAAVKDNLVILIARTLHSLFL